jgi:SAM-dependent methyltransferase
MMNNASMYDFAPQIAEIYDQVETDTTDVELILRLIGNQPSIRILEPFCGTGRILIPLALAGHKLVGLDQAAGMLARARMKVARHAEKYQRNITLLEANALDENWPTGFELVILGGNCFYELSDPQEQEKCIRNAFAVLNPGGYVYIDNDHMEGDLDESWRGSGVRPGFPSGKCKDGSVFETTMETIWVDIPNRLARFRRCTKVTLPDGRRLTKEYLQQKHPVSAGEVQAWLEKPGFIIEQFYGDHDGKPYTDQSDRAIYWARKP